MIIIHTVIIIKCICEMNEFLKSYWWNNDNLFAHILNIYISVMLLENCIDSCIFNTNINLSKIIQTKTIMF